MLTSQPHQFLLQPKIFYVTYCGAGLAEAGLLPSNFSLSSAELGEGGYDSDLEEMKFFPDRYAALCYDSN